MSSLFRSFLSRSGLVVIVASLAACSFNSGPSDGSDGAGNAGNAGNTGAPGTAAGSDAGPGAANTNSGPLPFKPSNGVDLGALDLSKATSEVSLTGQCTIDSEKLTIKCDYHDALPGIATKVVTLADQTRVAVFVAQSFRIETSTTVETKGAIPIVFAALDTIAVLGTIRVHPGTAGGALTTAAYERGGGLGGGTAATRSGVSGGGASFCGIGGKAASPGPAVSESPAAYGSPNLVPLVGGSAGAVGFFANLAQPSGGGALHLIAGTSILVAPSGAISAGGAGGDRGATLSGVASGGGSGGALLLEAPTVNVAGTLAANGGGGGGNAGAESPGENGKAGADAAAGGAGVEVGGTGSAGAALDGGNATWTNVKDPTGLIAGASGGGGGAGRIRINTATGAATITGVISPSLTTPCATQGTFTP